MSSKFTAADDYTILATWLDEIGDKIWDDDCLIPRKVTNAARRLQASMPAIEFDDTEDEEDQ